MDGTRDKTKHDRVQRRKVYRIKDQPLLVKTICDPNDVLSKKARLRLLNSIDDGMDEHVQYTLNKHRRWEYANSFDLITSVDNSACDVVVIEKRMISGSNAAFGEFVNYNSNQERAESITARRKNSSTIATASSKGLGTSATIMLKNNKCFRENENAEVAWEEPRLEYRIISPHWNQKIMGGETHTYETRSWRATFNKKYKKKHKKRMDPIFVMYNYDHYKSTKFDSPWFESREERILANLF